MRLIKIDESNRQDHPFLTVTDECYCLGEYIPRAGYDAGPINQLISNYKKPVDRRGRAEYRYKEQAIKQVGKLVRTVLNDDAIKICTVVPIPPSKARSDPLYDDRLVQSLRAVDDNLDVRELLVMKHSTRAHHEHDVGETRPTPDDLYEVLALDEACLTEPVKKTIILFDDLLTNGTHFRACKRLLNERFPDSNVAGLFIGRVKRPDAGDSFSVI